MVNLKVTKNVLIEHPSSVFKDNPALLLKAVEQWVLPEGDRQ